MVPGPRPSLWGSTRLNMRVQMKGCVWSSWMGERRARFLGGSPALGEEGPPCGGGADAAAGRWVLRHRGSTCSAGSGGCGGSQGLAQLAWPWGTKGPRESSLLLQRLPCQPRYALELWQAPPRDAEGTRGASRATHHSSYFSQRRERHQNRLSLRNARLRKDEGTRPSLRRLVTLATPWMRSLDPSVRRWGGGGRVELNPMKP